MEKHNQHIVIIGAGIVGISCAETLRQRGARVTLIDRDLPCEGTSSGNAGAIAHSEILPLASPGMMKKAPKWLFDPLGPLSIPPTYLPKLLPWMMKFWQSSSMDQVRKSAVALADLNALSTLALKRLYASTDLSQCLRPLGHLYVYQSGKNYEQSTWEWALRKELGINFSPVSAQEIQDLCPPLSGAIKHGVHIPDWMQVTDPKQVGQDMAQFSRKAGTAFIQSDVQHIDEQFGMQSISLSNGDTIIADKIVIAAGAWSHKLCAQWGERIPLETERGYNTTLPCDTIDLPMQVAFAEHGFVVSPLSSGIRVGGCVELGGLNAPPNYARADSILDKARQFFPDLKQTTGPQWMGYRPSLPDSLPVISRSSKRKDIFLAFGHGHAGLTQSAATAEIVADLVFERPPALDISPFKADRF